MRDMAMTYGSYFNERDMAMTYGSYFNERDMAVLCLYQLPDADIIISPTG